MKGDILKKHIIIKKLNMFAKSLEFLENESFSEGNKRDAEHYRFDKEVLKQAILIIERSNA